MLDALVFAHEVKLRVNYLELGEEVETIRAGAWCFEPSNYDDDDFRDVMERAAKACKSAREKFAGGHTMPEDWGLVWGKYYLFNRVVNSEVFEHVLKAYDNLAKIKSDNPLIRAAQRAQV